ncbi:DUF2959 domain-containing protein [Colwelliaceae bacterium 6441]
MTKNIFTFFVLILLLSGCQSAYYSAMEKVGTHKRDILIDRVEDATTSQEEAKEEFISALEQLSQLIAFDGGELQSQYELSKQSYDDSKEAADDVSARIASIEHVAEALFDEWRDEIEQYTSATLKHQSRRQMNNTEKRYLAVIKAMHKAEAKMPPILSALKDNMLYLKHNLNAKAIGALKDEYKIIKQDIDRLIIQMNQSIEDSKTFINTLKSS